MNTYGIIIVFNAPSKQLLNAHSVPSFIAIKKTKENNLHCQEDQCVMEGQVS